MGIFTKTRNKMAFGTPLYCPHPHPKDHNRKCGAQRWKADKHRSTPLRIRYVCRQCGKGVIYDISQHNPELSRAFKQPLKVA